MSNRAKLLLPLGILQIIQKLCIRTWQRTDSISQQLQMSRHVVQLQLDLVLHFFVQVSNLPGQIHIYMRVSGRNRHTYHNTCNHASIDGFCQTCNELTVFSTNTCLKDGTKTQRKRNSEVIDCNRLFPLAHQDCTTIVTSRKTVRNGSYPEKSKRTLQPTSTEYDGESARAQLNTQNFLKKTQDPQLLFSCCVFAAVG